MKQTAVEWLVNHWKKLQSEGEKMTWQQVIDITELAKEMEKEQIIDACNLQRNDYRGMPTYNKSGEKYYNETYGK